MNTVINSNNKEIAEKIAKTGDRSIFNCWGATLFILNKIDEIKWVGRGEMTDFLKNSTKEISKEDLKEGDIIALFENARFGYDAIFSSGLSLLHTAVYLTNDYYWHKMGSLKLETNTLGGILNTYPETVKIKYFRVL